MEHFYNKKD